MLKLIHKLQLFQVLIFPQMMYRLYAEVWLFWKKQYIIYFDAVSRPLVPTLCGSYWGLLKKHTLEVSEHIDKQSWVASEQLTETLAPVFVWRWDYKRVVWIMWLPLATTVKHRSLIRNCVPLKLFSDLWSIFPVSKMGFITLETTFFVESIIMIIFGSFLSSL